MVEQSFFYHLLTTTYCAIELGVYKGQQLLRSAQAETKQASSDCIPLIGELLKKTSLSLTDLDFIGAYRGPAPFTTLRVSLASVNGLAFATKLPLIGVNGLQAFAESVQSPDYDMTYVLLHAFGKDLYTGIFDNRQKKMLFYGCLPVTDVITRLEQEAAQSIVCVGNGARMHVEAIKNTRPGVTLAEPLPEACSLDDVASLAVRLWRTKTDITDQIEPLYLKNHPAQGTICHSI